MEFLQVVQKGLDILLNNLKPFIEETLMKVYGSEYYIYMEHGKRKLEEINTNLMKDYHINSELNDHKKYKDVLFYINALIKNWDVLRSLFSTNYILCLCHDVKYFRNKWAHQCNFNSRETYRFLDLVQAMLEEMKMNYYEIDQMRKSLLEIHYNEEVNKALMNTNITENNTNINYKENISIIQHKYNNLDILESSNQYSYQLNEEEDLIMQDGSEIDKENLHEINFQKVIKENKNSQFQISYYEEENGEKDMNNNNSN